MLGLSLGLFGEVRTLSEFPLRSGLTGLGFTDWRGYAWRLRRLFTYQNTYLDRRPKFDLCRKPDWAAEFDFAIALDVLEHVPPPVETAFRNLAAVIKGGGLAILSVPYSLADDTVEHFPNLNEYSIVKVFGSACLVNKRRDGALEIFDRPVFHGGPGKALEMRVFARRHLIELLSGVGLSDIRFVGHWPEWGIIYENECSHVVMARKTG